MKDNVWISVNERMPEITKSNPYPTCLVWRECVCGGTMKGVGGMFFGELRLLGGDVHRPYWVRPEKSANLEPLENTAWKVTYWMELPSAPGAKL